MSKNGKKRIVLESQAAAKLNDWEERKNEDPSCHKNDCPYLLWVKKREALLTDQKVGEVLAKHNSTKMRTRGERVNLSKATQAAALSVKSGPIRFYLDSQREYFESFREEELKRCQCFLSKPTGNGDASKKCNSIMMKPERHFGNSEAPSTKVLEATTSKEIPIENHTETLAILSSAEKKSDEPTKIAVGNGVLTSSASLDDAIEKVAEGVSTSGQIYDYENENVSATDKDGDDSGSEESSSGKVLEEIIRKVVDLVSSSSDPVGDDTTKDVVEAISTNEAEDKNN